MTDWEIKIDVLDFLPTELHAEVIRRCHLAKDYTSVGLWAYDKPPNLNDLVAINPKTGCLEFLREDGPTNCI
jgi:hypothetical protein